MDTDSVIYAFYLGYEVFHEIVLENSDYFDTSESHSVKREVVLNANTV